MMKFLHSAAKISNEEASQVFRQFAWTLGGVLQNAKSVRAKPQKSARSRSRANSTAAKRSPKQVAN